MMNCKFCGGKITTTSGKCPYCGNYNDEVLRFVNGVRLTMRGPGEHMITGYIKIPFEVRRTLNEETGVAILKKRFAEMFAEQIEDYIQITLMESCTDPLGDMTAMGEIVVKEIK